NADRRSRAPVAHDRSSGDRDRTLQHRRHRRETPGADGATTGRGDRPRRGSISLSSEHAGCGFERRTLMPRVWKIAIAVLALLVLAALLTFPALLRNVLGLRRATRSEEQVLRAIVPPISTPTDTRGKAQLFWLSPTSRDTLESTTVELDLSADTEERAKQLIAALI